MLGIRECINNGFSLYYNRFVVNRILFIRHGETNCNVNLMKEGLGKVELNSNLTQRGINQGKDLANFLKEKNYNPSIVLTSPLNRAIDTCRIFIDDEKLIKDHNLIEINKKEDTVIDNRRPWIYKKETDEDFRLRIFNWFEKQKHFGSLTDRKDTICFTHSGVIATVLGMYEKSPYLADNKEIFLNHRYHISNCSITCVDILEVSDHDKNLLLNGKKVRKTHITNVNYNSHLTEPTGNHNCLV